MCVRGRQLTVLAVFFWCGFAKGTDLASAASPFEKPSSEACAIRPIFSAEEEVKDSNSKACEPPRFRTTCQDLEDAGSRLVLPMHSAGSSQWTQSGILQQLRIEMDDSAMVANTTRTEPFTKPPQEGQGEEAECLSRRWCDGEVTGRRHLGAVWNWRPPNSKPLGGDYPDQNGESNDPNGTQAVRRTTSCANGRKDRGERQGGTAEKDSYRERDRRQGDSGPAYSFGGTLQRQSPAGDHPQDVESAPKGGEAIHSRHHAAAGVRRPMEEMESLHAAKICGTGEAVQGEKERVCAESQGVEGEASGLAQRNTTGSHTEGGACGHRGVLGGSRGETLRPGHGGSYHFQQRRRGEEEETSYRDSCDGEFTGESFKDEVRARKVSFNEMVTANLYAGNEMTNCYEFATSLDRLAGWDSKPWALYEGAFVENAKWLFDRVCQCAGSEHVAIHQDCLHRPVLHGDQARGVHGDQLPGGDQGDSVAGGANRAQLHDVSEEILQDEESQVPGIIHMFGVNGGFLGRRQQHQTHFDFSHAAIWDAIESRWDEYAEVDFAFQVPTPQPAPDEGYPGVKQLYVLVDFLPLPDPMHRGKVAVLCEIKGWKEDGTMTRRLEGAMLQERVNWVEIARELALQEQCIHRVGNQCIIRLGTVLILDDGPYVLADDGLISISFDVTNDMVDRISLLQTFQKKGFRSMMDSADPDGTAQPDAHVTPCEGTSPRGVSTAPSLNEAFRHIQQTRFHQDVDMMTDESGALVHLFHRTSDYIHAALDADNPFEERRQVARLWNVLEQEIVALHPVLHPPEDLRGRVLITRWRQDDHYKVLDTDKLVLFDIELHSGDEQQPTLKLHRHVEWTRVSMTRANFLATVYAEAYCRLVVQDRCLVWHNQQLWPLQDMGPRVIRHGDSIRIAVPALPSRSAGELRQALRQAEDGARAHQHYIPHTDSETEGQEESESEPETRYGRSPSLSEPEPLDHYIDSAIAAQVDAVLGEWRCGTATAELYLLCGCSSGLLTCDISTPIQWSSLAQVVRKSIGDLIHFHITFHPVLSGMERRFRRCRIVVEFSHIAVRLNRTQSIPALWCSWDDPNQRRWKAIYVPSYPEQFAQWERNQPRPLWKEQLDAPSAVVKLLCEQEHEHPSGNSVQAQLAAAGTVLITLHCYGIQSDGHTAGCRSEVYHRWHLDHPSALKEACMTLWPEFPEIEIKLPNPGAFTHGQGELQAIVYNKGTKADHKFWCSLVFQSAAESATSVTFAVGAPKGCTLQLLQDLLGLRGTSAGTLLDEQGHLPELHDGDHLRLRGALRHGDGHRREVRHALSAASDLPLPWTDVGFLDRPRSEPICLAQAIDGNHYRPRSNEGANHDPGGIDFGEVLSLWEWLDASQPEVQWTLPDEVHWHPNSIPWTSGAWWNLGYADEIAIYTDGSASQHGSSSAAVIFVASAGHWFFGGYLKQDLPGPRCAHRAELCGLLLAYHYLNPTLRRLAFQQPSPPKVSLLFDATSAGYKAAGYWKGSTYEHLTKTLRSLEFFLEARFQIAIDFLHVYGHTGDPGNEAANTIANFTNPDHRYDHSVWCKAFDNHVPEEIQWLWALWKPEWQYLWNGAILECPNHPVTQPQAGVFGPQDSVKDPSEGSEGLDLLHFDVKIASANVLTLLPKRGPAGVQGRARMEMLQKQFAQEGYHLIGVQEARVRTEIKIEQEGFLVFSAPASAAGHYGCQLWISTTLPFGPPGTCVKPQHCKVVAKDPRFLIIQIKAPFLRAIVISAHAPTSQASHDTISKWWHTLGQAVPTRLRQWPQILLVDANARVGSHPSLAVGPYQGDEQDGGGDELHGYLIANQLWLPATFEEQHEGEAGTWKHPKTEEWSRGDFIGLPRAWTFSRCRSFIETNVDLSLSREDHRPPAVHLQWSALPFTSGPNRPRRTTYDVQSLKQDLTGTNYCGTIGSLRASLGTMPWNVDVHTHTATLQHCLRHWMATWYGKRRKQPRRPNMSEETWTLVLAKQEARKILFNNNLRQKRWHLQLCFGAWARGEIAAGETFAEACHQATTLQKFRLLGRQVTAALRRDDRKFFTDLANQIGANDTPGQCNQLWQKIRWMLPKAKSRRGVSPLLIESLDNQWMPHFAKLEAGTTTTAADLVNRCAARQAEGDAAVLPKLVDLPTRFEVEQILLRQQCNKAAGPDGLPSDLYRYAASTIAAPLHDIICKTVCWNMEAVQNKGGVMYPLHKKGHQEVAANYRGVMLLNIASKILHSWVRTRMMSHLETIRPDTQIGGFKHQQVTYGAHCIQLVAKLAHHHQVPMSCIFLDVQGAYHFLIHDLVMGPSPPVDVERILQNLQEWEIDQRGVQLWMKLPCILERLRFPSALIRLLREIHLDTWAQLPHLDEVLRTTKGSRPGSPLADAVYAALMLDIHVEVDRILAESEVVTAGFKTLQIDGFAVTWADDLAIPVVANTNEELIPAVLWVAQRVHAAFERRGLLLNMQRGKTTAVLAFRGKEGPRYRKEHLLTPNPGADLHLSQGRTLRLHFCSAYRHLGAVFIPDGEVTTEVASRLGQAKTAYHSLKKNLFGNRKLSPRTRLKLFEALIVSKLCFGVCTWGHLQRRSWQSIETFVTRAQRYIYNGEIGGVTTSEITSRYQLPSLQQRISSARLKYAVRLFTNGPTTLATLLAAEDEVSQTSWWKHVEEDLRWCGSLLGPDLPVQADDREALVKSWKLQSTLWWRTFRKAFKISLLQEATAADVRYWHGQIVRVLIDGGESIDHLYNYGKQEQCYG